jgi:hypothetical protein
MPAPKLVRLPSAAQRWLRLILALTVSVAIGLAPLLGLLPTDLQPRIIPITSALMGLVAVGVQWYSQDALSNRARRLAFKRTLIIAVAVLTGFYIVSTPVVKPFVYGEPSDLRTDYILVAFCQPNKPPCGGMSKEECLQVLTSNRVRIATFYGSQNLEVAQLALVLPYLVFMTSFAVAVGLVVQN